MKILFIRYLNKYSDTSMWDWLNNLFLIYFFSYWNIKNSRWLLFKVLHLVKLNNPKKSNETKESNFSNEHSYEQSYETNR